MTKYRSYYTCAYCSHRLTWHELMHSDGVCPHCAIASPGTVCEYVKHAERIPEPPEPKPDWAFRLALLVFVAVAALILFSCGGGTESVPCEAQAVQVECDGDCEETCEGEK